MTLESRLTALVQAIGADIKALFLKPSTPAGTGAELQFRNGAALGAASGTDWDDASRSLTINGATVTASKPVLDLAQTWNNAAVAFTAYKFNVTNMASASTSKLVDLRVNGLTVFSVTSAGNLALSRIDIGNYLSVTNNAALGYVQLIGGRLDFGSNNDTFLYKDGASIIAQRNGTNAQTARWYLSYTDASNYARLSTICTTSNYQRKAEAAGTGALKPIVDSYYTSANDPTATDIPAGFSGIWKNSTTDTVKLWANNGGTLVSVTLA